LGAEVEPSEAAFEQPYSAGAAPLVGSLVAGACPVVELEAWAAVRGVQREAYPAAGGTGALAPACPSEAFALACGAWGPCPPGGPSRVECRGGAAAVERRGAGCRAVLRLTEACPGRRAAGSEPGAWRPSCCRRREAFADLATPFLCLDQS